MMKNLETELHQIEQQLLSFGREEIDKRFGKKDNLYISDTREGILVPIDPFSSYKVKNKDSLPIKTQLEFLDKGIWPQYMIGGSYVDSEITNYHYNRSHFLLFLSSNFCISHYTPDRGESVTQINPNSLLFLREQGITSDMWFDLESYDSSICDFSIKRLTSKQKNHICSISEKFKDKINPETELHVFVSRQSSFNRY